MAKVIALAGSLKEHSFNRQFLEVAGSLLAEQGVEVEYVDLRDYDVPLFSEDLEAEGLPDGVYRLKRLFLQSDGLLLASPEYNGSISGVLKNAIDWISRPSEGVAMGEAFQGKVAALLAASPSPLGGLRGLSHARDVLFNLGTVVLPGWVTLPAAYSAFDEQGKLNDEQITQRVTDLVSRLAETVKSS